MIPKVVICENMIDLLFLDFRLRIDTLTNALTVEELGGFYEIDYWSIKEPDFEKTHSKKKNIARPKARVFYTRTPRYVIGVDVGIEDHRLFFLAWRVKDFDEFRGAPFWKASYFVNSATKRKEWYCDNLSVPKTVWDFGEKTPIGSNENINIFDAVEA